MRKTVTVFVFSTMFLVSFAGVCTHMLAACGMECTPHTVSAMLQMETQLSGCFQNIGCPVSAVNHMAVFSHVYPAAAASGWMLLLLAVVGVLFMVWLNVVDPQRSDQIGRRIKTLMLAQQITRAITPQFLRSALSQGIINTKIYA